MDLFAKCNEFTAAREAIDAGLYPYFIPLDDTEGTEVTVNGRKVIMIGSNNYLGLTTHPKVRAARDRGNRAIWHQLHRISFSQRHPPSAPGIRATAC